MADGRSFLWVVGGSLIIALGSTIVGIMSFQNNPIGVFFGFLVFVVGYISSQLGSNGEATFERSNLHAAIDRENLLRFVFSILGLGGIAMGVTLFSQTVLDPDITSATLSGVSSIGGYMFAHVGINREGLGELLFEPIFAILSKDQ